MFDGIRKKVKAFVPKVIKAVKRVGKSILKKAVSAIPGVALAKKAIKKGKKAIKKIKKEARKKIEEIKKKNKRILEKVKEEWAETYPKLIRGITTSGAYFTLGGMQYGIMQKVCILTDFLLQARKAVIEEYPLLNAPTNLGKKMIGGLKNAITDKGQEIGSSVYEKNIPGLSDFVGEFTKVREKGAESNIFSITGAFAHGVIADGLGGTIEGIANVVVDPFEAVEGINKIFAYPEETIPAIASGVKEYIDKKIIHGTPEERAEAAGQGAFEIAEWLVGVGEAKAAAKAGDTAKLGKVVNKVDKVEDASKTAKVIKIGEKTRSLKESSKLLGKNIAKGFDDVAIKAYKSKEGMVSGIRTAMNNVAENIKVKPKLKLATPEGNINLIDDASNASKKIKAIEKNEVQKKFNEIYYNSKSNVPMKENVGSGVNIKSKVSPEDVGKVVDDSKVIKTAEKTSKKTNQLELSDITKEVLETKPMNSPKPEKWAKKGGSIAIDENGTWTYTNKAGQSVSYPNGYPDFSPYTHPTIEPVTIKVAKPKNPQADFKEANAKAGLSKNSDPPVPASNKPPEGYTWHHHEDGKTMILVDEDVHREFRHIGGQSTINGKNSKGE